MPTRLCGRQHSVGILTSPSAREEPLRPSVGSSLGRREGAALPAAVECVRSGAVSSASESRAFPCRCAEPCLSLLLPLLLGFLSAGCSPRPACSSAPPQEWGSPTGRCSLQGPSVHAVAGVPTKGGHPAFRNQVSPSLSSVIQDPCQRLPNSPPRLRKTPSSGQRQVGTEQAESRGEFSACLEMPIHASNKQSWGATGGARCPPQLSSCVCGLQKCT